MRCKLKKANYPDDLEFVRWGGFDIKELSKFVGHKIEITCDRGCCATIFADKRIDIRDGDYIAKDSLGNIYKFDYQTFTKVYDMIEEEYK